MPFLPAMTGNGNHTTYKNGDLGWFGEWFMAFFLSTLHQFLYIPKLVGGFSPSEKYES